MRHLTLAALDDQVLTEAFNAVYEGYVVPLRFTVEQMRRHVIANAIQLEHSPLWLDDTGQVVGLAAMGVRGQRGWVGGFGIAQAYRGKGLSHRLIEAVLTAARELQLAQLQLEVLTSNAAAIGVYERAGFVHRRDLCILASDAAQEAAADGAADARPVDVERLLAHAERLHPTPPSWQREPPSIAATRDLTALMVERNGSVAAYVIYEPTAAGVRVADLAADGREEVMSLLHALGERFPGVRLSLNNEPAESWLIGVLEELQWRETLRQHEMIHTLVNT